MKEMYAVNDPAYTRIYGGVKMTVLSSDEKSHLEKLADRAVFNAHSPDVATPSILDASVVNVNVLT